MPDSSVSFIHSLINNNQNDKIINFDHLPFEIKIKKHNKFSIRIPAWLATLTPIITKREYIQQLIKKVFDKTDQTDLDIKLIESILEELTRINNDN